MEMTSRTVQVNMLHANHMLGSQAETAVLVDQPQAYITQKARIKRNRRTEWEYYVHFPGFADSESQWYSARDIKTQHPRGAELIREFEDAGEDLDRAPQQAQQAVPLTQDAGPSQIGNFSAEALPSSSQQHHFYTQAQAPAHETALANPPDVPPALTAGFQPVHGNQHQMQFSSAPYTKPQDQPSAAPLHWSFERLRQAQAQTSHSAPHPDMPSRDHYFHHSNTARADPPKPSASAQQHHSADYAHVSDQPTSSSHVQQQQQWQQPPQQQWQQLLQQRPAVVAGQYVQHAQAPASAGQLFHTPCMPVIGNMTLMHTTGFDIGLGSHVLATMHKVAVCWLCVLQALCVQAK